MTNILAAVILSLAIFTMSVAIFSIGLALCDVIACNGGIKTACVPVNAYYDRYAVEPKS